MRLLSMLPCSKHEQTLIITAQLAQEVPGDSAVDVSSISVIMLVPSGNVGTMVQNGTCYPRAAMAHPELAGHGGGHGHRVVAGQAHVADVRVGGHPPLALHHDGDVSAPRHQISFCLAALSLWMTECSCLRCTLIGCHERVGER